MNGKWQKFFIGKNILVMGVANKRSIFWAIARAQHGRSLSPTRMSDLKTVARLVQSEMSGALLLPCNVAEDGRSSFNGLLEEKWRRCTALCTASLCPEGRTGGALRGFSREGFHLALDISVIRSSPWPAGEQVDEGWQQHRTPFQGLGGWCPITTSWEWPRPLWKLPSATTRPWASRHRVNAISAAPSAPHSAKGVGDFNGCCTVLRRKHRAARGRCRRINRAATWPGCLRLQPHSPWLRLSYYGCLASTF